MKKLAILSALLFNIAFINAQVQLQLKSQSLRHFLNAEVTATDSLEFIYSSPTQGLLSENKPFILNEVDPEFGLMLGGPIHISPFYRNLGHFRSFQVDQVNRFTWNQFSNQQTQSYQHYSSVIESILNLSANMNTRNEFFYNSDSLLSLIVTSYQDSTGWNEFIWEHFEYNTQGKLVYDSMSFEHINDPGSGIENVVTKTFYSQNRVVEQQFRLNEVNTRYQFNYDIFGRLSSYAHDRDDLLYEENGAFYYNNANQLSTSEYNLISNNTVVSDRHSFTTYQYSNDRLVSVEMQADSAQSLTELTYLNDNFLKSIYTSGSSIILGNQQTNETYTTFYYTNESELALTNPEATVSIEVYPNPTSNFIHIKSDTEVSQLSLYDMNGRIAMRQTGSNHMDVQSLPKGEYLLSIHTAHGNVIKSVILQ